jgi:hypothetical protein
MDTLQPLRTSHFDPLSSHESFSVLPSPSTYGLGNTYGDYSAPSYDFSTLSSSAYDSPSPAGSIPELSHSSPAFSDRASSPATSFHSTPRGSPAMDKAVVLLPNTHGNAFEQLEGSVTFNGFEEPHKVRLSFSSSTALPALSFVPSRTPPSSPALSLPCTDFLSFSRRRFGKQ